MIVMSSEVDAIFVARNLKFNIMIFHNILEVNNGITSQDTLSLLSPSPLKGPILAKSNDKDLKDSIAISQLVWYYILLEHVFQAFRFKQTLSWASEPMNPHIFGTHIFLEPTFFLELHNIMSSVSCVVPGISSIYPRNKDFEECLFFGPSIKNFWEKKFLKDLKSFTHVVILSKMLDDNCGEITTNSWFYFWYVVWARQKSCMS